MAARKGSEIDLEKLFQESCEESINFLSHIKKSIEKSKFDGTQGRSDKDKKDFVFFLGMEV